MALPALVEKKPLKHSGVVLQTPTDHTMVSSCFEVALLNRNPGTDNLLKRFPDYVVHC